MYHDCDFLEISFKGDFVLNLIGPLRQYALAIEDKEEPQLHLYFLAVSVRLLFRSTCISMVVLTFFCQKRSIVTTECKTRHS